jgi:uncharacterized protein YjbI with pentapeptide repeats
LAAPIAAQADSPPQPIPADGKCAVPADPNWTKQEQFVWLNVCVGKEANFNEAPDFGVDLDHKSPTGLLESRILRSSFLEAILLKDEYRSALTHLGVHITGARFTEPLNLQNAELQHDLWLDRSLLEQGANLSGAETKRQMAFDHSKILGTFSAAGAQIDKGLYMRGDEFHENIYLSDAHIGRQLVLDGSRVAGMLDMSAIHVGDGLFMRDKAQFKAINLFAAHIGGQLDLSSSTVTGMLNMNGISVDQVLIMRNKAQFKEIDLRGAHIEQLDLSSSTVTGTLDMTQIHTDQALFMGNHASFSVIDLAIAHIGQLDLNGSTVTGKFAGDYIDVGQTMSLGYGTFEDEIDLRFATLGQDLDLSGGTFYKDVNLGGAKFDSILGLHSAHWVGDATLNLTGAAAGRIDLSDSWPDRTSASEFTYRDLANMSQNISKQAEKWFSKQVYAPQPYEQLASVLQANGLIEDATAIRYAGREQERRTAPWGLHWAWLVLLDWSIGFGYYLQFAFYWAVGFVLLGWAVLYFTGQRTKHGMTLGLTYSFDMLLPLVQLNKKHDDVDLDPWPQRYFYAHKIIGVILTSFIVAGISGLTK